MNGVLPGLVRCAGIPDFCPALVAVQSAQYKICFFLTVKYFSSFVHIAQQAGPAVVLGHLSLNMCLWLKEQTENKRSIRIRLILMCITVFILISATKLPFAVITLETLMCSEPDPLKGKKSRIRINIGKVPTKKCFPTSPPPSPVSLPHKKAMGIYAAKTYLYCQRNE